MLTLSTPVSFSPRVVSACLPAPHEAIVGLTTVAGWGLTETGGRTSNVLQKLDLDVVPTDK